jgi:predicted RNA binding protein YcfA (HicA-like mRNA interferase family)
MPDKYPPLTYSDTVAILKALGFSYKNQEGSHEHWIRQTPGRKFKVTLQKNQTYGARDIRSHISQSGVTREEYYGACDRTAKKIK